MGEQRESGIVAITGDADVMHGCHQILSAVNILVVNLEWVSDRVEGETKTAVDEARASLDRIVDIARAIGRLHERSAQRTGGTASTA